MIHPKKNIMDIGIHILRLDSGKNPLPFRWWVVDTLAILSFNLSF